MTLILLAITSILVPTVSPKTDIALKPWITKEIKLIFDFPEVRLPRFALIISNGILSL